MADHFPGRGATIDSREIFFYCGGEQCLAAHRRAVGFIDWLGALRTRNHTCELIKGQ
jgi:hypothetical protein